MKASPAGFEPATYRLEGGCSIQLSYGDFIIYISQSSNDRALANFSANFSLLSRISVPN